MAIKTSTFGDVTLSGNAAKAFKKQFLTGHTKPKLAAQVITLSIDQNLYIREINKLDNVISEFN